MYNGNWDPANISGPDGNGYITLSVTYTGGALYGAEMFTDLTNFGYGTYTIVVGSRLDTLPKTGVFGGLFTYSDTGTGNAAVTNNEIDVNETSAWGEATSVSTSHNYFVNSSSVKTGTDDPYTTTADTVTTHVMTWTPTSLTFDSYVGTGTGGTNLKHTVATTNVPDPSEGSQFLDINAWIFGDGSISPTSGDTFSVIVRDMSYTPYVEPSGGSNKTGFFFGA